jgi:hypothetical protein
VIQTENMSNKQIKLTGQNLYWQHSTLLVAIASSMTFSLVFDSPSFAEPFISEPDLDPNQIEDFQTSIEFSLLQLVAQELEISQKINGGDRTALEIKDEDRTDVSRKMAFININKNQQGQTLVGEDKPNVWQITNKNEGILNGTIRFKNIRNLQGGKNTDVFKFTSDGNISGIIDGGGGKNTLDYSNSSILVKIDLDHNSATGTNGIKNLQAVIGSKGSNTLIAENINNNWNITGTNSGTLNDKFTFSNIQNLIGGNKTDIFAFNGGSIGSIDGGEGENSVAAGNSRFNDRASQEEDNAKDSNNQKRRTSKNS